MTQKGNVSVQPHFSTPIGVPPKKRSSLFDRILSLKIDSLHDELDRLASRRGLRVCWRRWQLRRQLRRLEARIPR